MAKVTVIDSDNVRRERLVFSLESSGHQAEGLDCAISALESARENRPDIILCSDTLPGLSPIDLLEMRLDSAFLSDLPIMVFGNSPHRKQDFFKAGCEDFIVLPADEGEISLRIGALLKRAKQGGVSGSFAHIGIFDLIQLFMGARQTGLLEVDSDDLKAMLVIEAGQVGHCSIEGKDSEDGEACFIDILRASQSGGDFTFTRIEAEDIPEAYSESNISKRTDHLLLGIANILDEGG